MDIAIQPLQLRFEQLKQITIYLGFLSDSRASSVMTYESLQRASSKHLCHQQTSRRIYGCELADKVESLRHILPDTAKTPVEILTYLFTNER